MADPSDVFGGGYAQDGPGIRRYNPYKDLHVPYRAIYNLPTSPEFLFQEESLAHRRSWGENLTYFTGCGYLAGASAGAGKGLLDALRASEPGDSLKLRVNRVLNGAGQAGRRAGNRLGVIGLLYAGMESGVACARGADDWGNSVAAGLGAGALFRAASGPRSAAVAGALGGLVVGGAMVARQVAKRYVPI